MELQEILGILVYPSCKSNLRLSGGKLICSSVRCKAEYNLINGKPAFVAVKGVPAPGQQAVSPQKARGLLKQDKLVKFISSFITCDYIPQMPVDYRELANLKGPKTRLLEIGSGSRRIHERAINLDLMPFENVDIMADGHSLPFASESLDVVVIDVVLEHVAYPEIIVSEIHRTLKKGGLVYAVVPFVHPYHDHPADYHRWSISGVELLFKDFKTKKIGVLRGPSVAILNAITSGFPYLLTFSKSNSLQLALKGFMLLFLFPLKYLDKLLVKNPQSHILAHSFYYLGEK